MAPSANHGTNGNAETDHDDAVLGADGFCPSTEQFAIPAELRGVTVRMPDLFVDVMSAPHARCPHFEKVKAEADGWLSEVYHKEPKKAQYYVKANFALLAALWLPNGDAWGLRLLADWNHWSFPFDDQFDEGHLKYDALKAVDEVMDTMAICDEETYPLIPAEESPLRHMFQTMWLHYKERTSINQQDLFREAHRQYFTGLIKQTLWAREGFAETPTAEQYMVYRRECLGGWPTLVVAEAAMGVDLPRHVRDHPAVAACGLAMTDIVIIDNDILSMKKDLKYGVKHNLIVRLVDRGLTLQQAMNEAGRMLDERYRTWHASRAAIPSWGADIDKGVVRLLEVWRDVTLGSLWWSFESGRYFGEMGEEVKKTRIITL